MRRVLPFLVLVSLAGCRSVSSPVVSSAPAVPRKVTIASGTPVKLVLLDELTSGGSQEAQTVRLALAQAVNGLPAMSPATATVAWSRSEGTLGGLTNRPARLTLRLESLTGPSGETIPLSADATQAKDYELTRGNTGRPSGADVGEEQESAQRAVRDLVARGEAGGLDAKEVGELARRMGMRETARLADAGELGKVQKLLATVRSGGAVASLAGGEPVAAALELVNVAGDVGRRLGRTLGGRNIRAYPGTEVSAFVARETVVSAL